MIAVAEAQGGSNKTDIYTVKRGDNLVSIAKARLGDSARWKELYTLNRNEIGHYTVPLYPGQILILPDACEEQN